MDMGFFAFEWFDQLTTEGYFWISRLREKTSYEIVHTFYQQGDTFDGIIWLGAYRADRAKSGRSLPGGSTLRTVLPSHS